MGPTTMFYALFLWRYVRQIVHLFSFWCYKPAPPVENPRYRSDDVTFIMATIDPNNPDFEATLTTCLRNRPRCIIICTAGWRLRTQTVVAANMIQRKLLSNADTGSASKILVKAIKVANRRLQLAEAAQLVRTAFIAVIDDHTTFNPQFLKSALLPFEEDSLVGIVGTNKRVLWRKHSTLVGRLYNMLKCLYLERHNFETRASSTIDGGVFVISGRAFILRACIMQDPEFLARYTNERFFFGCFGPLSPDDDNFITRYCIEKRWKLRVQHTKETLIKTNLGSDAKFRAGLIRWARSTWRSNMASVLTPLVWVKLPWTVYAVYLSSLTNLALLYDPILVVSLYHSHFYTKLGGYSFVALLVWMLAFKMIKPFPYFLRHPEDLTLLPVYLTFTWFHSLIKLWGLLTFMDCRWTGRNTSAITVEEGTNCA